MTNLPLTNSRKENYLRIEIKSLKKYQTKTGKVRMFADIPTNVAFQIIAFALPHLKIIKNAKRNIS